MGQADIYRNKAAELTRELASIKSLREGAKIRRERNSYIMLANSEDWLDGKIKETEAMSDHIYPVDLHRRFEQRWSARFATAAAVKPAKPRKNVATASRRQITIEENPIANEANPSAKKRTDHA